MTFYNHGVSRITPENIKSRLSMSTDNVTRLGNINSECLNQSDGISAGFKVYNQIVLYGILLLWIM